MAYVKDVLVTTTSSFEGRKVKRYMKPVSAHIVAGTNMFSDFFASFSDVFGGRSHTYQRQLVSLYDEAIERLKIAAYELGANCILGLSIDMDEISGKGKSMFMLTAVGTAVFLEKETTEQIRLPKSDEIIENIGIDRINILKNKKSIITKANSNTLMLNEEIWSFITVNQVYEIFPFLLNKYGEAIASDQKTPGTSANYYKLFIAYIDALPDNEKLDILYSSITREKNAEIVMKLSQIIKELNLFDFNRSMVLLQSNDFQIQKRGVRIITYDKPFYNKRDEQNIQTIADFIKVTFNERGKRSTKKQLLSSKEREVWICDCGKTNDLGTYCSGCGEDIYGFNADEITPTVAIYFIQQKIDLISELLA